jgi:Zinc dependent phospholipase C
MRAGKARFRGTACGRVVLLLVATLFAINSSGYSVLTHEELIDLAWNDSIRPLLLAKFPGTTEEQLREAHAYAYGGSAMQDMGYYPFGKKFFSNLTHYVRTGDFVGWMLRNARTIDEYAFAIGALSHYLGDSIGHSQAVNPATAVEFPKLSRKFGDSVTYGESPHGHIRTEFAFDIDQLTNSAFAPPAYLQAIGFKVPRKFLERAFMVTYGFDIHELFGRARPSLRSYRTAVRSFIPAFAEAEVVLHRKQFPPQPDDEAYRIFAERVSRTNYDRHWKHTYTGPGFKSHLLAIFVFLVPKIGAASDLAIKIPNAETQEWYLRSVNHTVDVFHDTLHKELAAVDPPVELVNLDLDTGKVAKLGDYSLADQTYGQLLTRITSKPAKPIPKELKQHILDYYTESATNSTLPHSILEQLATLKNVPVERP